MKAANLATRPARNQRPWLLLLAFTLLALLACSLVHGWMIVRTHPRETARLSSELADLERRSEALERELRSLKIPAPSKSESVEWERLQELVDARVFRWVDLFAKLGEALPVDTRLVSIAPTMEKDGVALDIGAVARSAQGIFATVRSLEAHPAFEDVYMRDASRQEEGVMARLALKYRPLAAVEPPPARGPKAEEG